MTSAIDNRTTELREKLTERGVEFATDDFDHLLTTSWKINDVFAKYLESIGDYVDEDDPTMKLKMNNVTPEQAIAATLGEKPRDRTEEWLLNACNQVTQDYVTQLEQEVDELKDKLEAATLGSGTLTAEQVRKAIFDGSTYASYDGAQYYANGISMQAIADELNARAERMCRIIEYDEAPYPVCSECGAVQPDDYTVYFCWNCGAKVRDA